MIDKNEQDSRPKTQDTPSTSSGQARPKQGRILRAKDIIPGTERTAGSDEESGAKEFDIPRFNLANDIMSAQRRQSVIRRKGPEAEEYRRQRTEDRGRKTEDSGQKMVIRHLPSVICHLSERDSIIAEIVARDIERLCSGH